MSRAARAASLGLATLLLGLMGCSTPQSHLDQANHGATLTLAVQAELAAFRSAQSAVAQQRLDSIRRKLASLATYRVESDFDDRLRQLAGGGAQTLHAELRALADSRGSHEAALARQLAELDAKLTQLLAPLPDKARGPAATQQALAVLGDELSARDRMAAASRFARTVKAAIEAQRNRIDAARQATPASPVQPPAP